MCDHATAAQLVVDGLAVVGGCFLAWVGYTFGRTLKETFDADRRD